MALNSTKLINNSIKQTLCMFQLACIVKISLAQYCNDEPGSYKVNHRIIDVYTS